MCAEAFALGYGYQHDLAGVQLGMNREKETIFTPQAQSGILPIRKSFFEWKGNGLNLTAFKKGANSEKGTEIAPYSDGGAQESGKRAGTENIALIVGMATALHENNLTIKDNEVHLLEMEQNLLRHLDDAGIDYIRNGSKNRILGTLSLSFRGFEGEMLLHRLDLKGICVSTGSACDSKNTQISHVLQAIGLEEEYAVGTIRISLGRLNTTAEVTAIADAIISIIK